MLFQQHHRHQMKSQQLVRIRMKIVFVLSFPICESWILNCIKMLFSQLWSVWFPQQMERMCNQIAIITRANRPVLARRMGLCNAAGVCWCYSLFDSSYGDLYFRALYPCFFAVTILLFDNDDCKLIVLLKLHNKWMV